MFKLNLGCGPFPIHDQHLEVMGDLSEWILVDWYVKDDRIANWDATNLPIQDKSCDVIYASHLLEHIPHVDNIKVLTHWYNKLHSGGKLILNVPDLEWACRRLLQYEDGRLLDGYYNTFSGEHGLISIFYGSQSHDGEYHKSGYTKTFINRLLKDVGFIDIQIEQIEEAHDMGCLIVTATK